MRIGTKALLPALCVVAMLAGCDLAQPHQAGELSAPPAERQEIEEPGSANPLLANAVDPIEWPVNAAMAAVQRARFAGVVGTSYDATVEIQCFCANSAVPIRIEVREGVIMRAIRAPDEHEAEDVTDRLEDYNALTVDGIHAAIETAARAETHTAAAAYDFRGIPRTATIELVEEAADDGVTFFVTDVVAVPADGRP